MEATTLDLEHLLRLAGLRVTRSRTTVLAAVHAHPHADTDMVVDAARRTLSDLSRQAVHDSLRALVEVGLVRRFQLESVVRFEAETGDDHHHAVCTSCGQIANVDCVGGGLSCLSPANTRGFVVSAVEVVYRGLCPDCAGRTDEPSGPRNRQNDDRRSGPGHALPAVPVPTVARDPRLTWTQTGPRRATSRPEANEPPGPAPSVEGAAHDAPGAGTSQIPADDAPPARRRARHKATWPQPV